MSEQHHNLIIKNKVHNLFKSLTIERYDEIQHSDRAFGVIIKHYDDTYKDIAAFEISEPEEISVRESISVEVQNQTHKLIQWLEAELYKIIDPEMKNNDQTE